MAELKIFIAGSKSLKQERNDIKVIANDLSSFYSSQGIHIIAHSYEQFGNDQDIYNKFIVNDADIVMFILDNRIGPKTEEELLAAAKAFRKDGRPEIQVFVREFDEKNITPDIAHVQGLMKGCFGDGKYHIDYSDLNDLKMNAKDCIVKYIENHKVVLAANRSSAPADEPVLHKGKPVTAPVVRSGAVCKRGMLFSSLLTAAVVLLAVLGWNRFASEPMLIFTGGGSVVDYMKDITGGRVDVKDYGNSLYINLPSGNAWTMLIEEAVRKNEDNERPFVSVVLSADRIDPSTIEYKVQNIKQDACIVGYFMGHDSLAVYIENKLVSSQGLLETDAELDAGKLASIIRYVTENPDSARLFTTNIASGTLRMYQRVVGSVDSLIDLDELLGEEISYPFYQDSSSDYLCALDGRDKCPFIILGSEHYYPSNLRAADCNFSKTEDVRKFYVRSNGGLQMKEMYIYFVTYMNGDKNYCSLDPQIIEFLKELGAREKLGERVWSEVQSGRIKKPGGVSMFYLNK